jgi:CheY-like chemotaxis protein
MPEKHNASPIPRHYLFTLQDGTVVVQWVAQKVQEIMTGVFRPYTGAEYGQAITNGQLDWLIEQKYVSHYTSRYVWLLPIVSSGAPPSQRGSHRVRAYYIMTTLPAGRFAEVERLLAGIPNLPETAARLHDEKVAVYGNESRLFRTLQDAEQVLLALQQAVPGVFDDALVAVFEVALGRQAADGDELKVALWPGLEDLAKTDTMLTADKRVVIVGSVHPEQKTVLSQLFSDELEMQVVHCQDGKSAIPVLEDNPPTLAVVDLDLPDTHGWTFIRDVREIRSLSDLTILVLSDNPSDEVFTLKVAKVAGFFSYPLNMRAVREKVWLLLRDGAG